jgi:hypothetical protein
MEKLREFNPTLKTLVTDNMSLYKRIKPKSNSHSRNDPIQLSKNRYKLQNANRFLSENIHFILRKHYKTKKIQNSLLSQENEKISLQNSVSNLYYSNFNNKTLNNYRKLPKSKSLSQIIKRNLLQKIQEVDIQKIDEEEIKRKRIKNY